MFTSSRRFLVSAALCAGVVVVLTTSLAGRQSVFPTGTTRYDPAKAYNSFVLFTGGDGVARLMDMNGNTVREWKNAADLATLIDPAVNGGRRGHVFVAFSRGRAEAEGVDLEPGAVGNNAVRDIGELDWDGKTVWTFGPKAPNGLARMHHDWARLPNGNTLVLSNMLHPLPGFKLPRILDDVLYEVNPAGEIVWRWIAGDHLDEMGFAQEQMALLRNTDDPDYLHFNSARPLGPNKWFTGGDQRFHPDNIIFSARTANMIGIVDRRSGKIVWALGPNHDPKLPLSRRVPRPFDRTAGQHDPHMIPEGLPGAGNILVFDNEGPGGYPNLPLVVIGGSRVLEIDPVKKEIVWQYSGEDSGGPGWSFRSTHISNARRLPNGNTFINEGQRGRFFQVTPTGEIVWEWVNTYPRRGNAGRGGGNAAAATGAPDLRLYRGQPVPFDWVPAPRPTAMAVVPPDPTQFRVTGTR